MIKIAEVKNICRRQSYLETVIWEHMGETELEWLTPYRKSLLDTASFAESFRHHPYLQIMMMNTYWFLINYEFDIVQSIPNYGSTREQTEEIEQILLFLYQNISANYYNGKAVAYQACEFDKSKLAVLKSCLEQNGTEALMKELYPRQLLADDVQIPVTYLEITKSQITLKTHPNKYIDGLFQNTFFRNEGFINISALSLDEISHLQCVNDILNHVEHLYVYNYRLVIHGETHYTKYLYWY